MNELKKKISLMTVMQTNGVGHCLISRPPAVKFLYDVY